MLFSVKQAFVGRDEIRAPLKRPAWEANLTVVWTVVGTRLIAFALAARAMPLKKVILTRKFVLLVAGNPTHLKFI